MTIYNPNDRDVVYTHRWCDDEEWQTWTVPANNYNWHAWNCDCLETHELPRLQFCFDSTFSDDHPEKEYVLEPYTGSDVGAASGRPYHFKIEGNGNDIDLWEGKEPAIPGLIEGSSTVTVDNRLGEMVHVRLVGPTLSQISLDPGVKITMSDVSRGSYALHLRYGADGNDRYRVGDSFDVTEAAGTATHASFTLQQGEGNYKLRNSSASEFAAVWR